jgi:hypothetical protein
MYLEILGIVALLVAFVFIIAPLLGITERYTEMEDDGESKFYFFHASWCGWCKKAWPHWKEFRKLFDNRKVTYGGKNVKLIEVDADKDKDMCKKFNIEGYPSFRLTSSGKTMEYKGGPSVDKFREFLKEKLGYEMVE